MPSVDRRDPSPMPERSRIAGEPTAPADRTISARARATRAAARRFFHIDGPSVVVRALEALADEGRVDPYAAAQAVERYRLHDVTAGTSGAVGGDN